MTSKLRTTAAPVLATILCVGASAAIAQPGQDRCAQVQDTQYAASYKQYQSDLSACGSDAGCKSRAGDRYDARNSRIADNYSRCVENQPIRP